MNTEAYLLGNSSDSAIEKFAFEKKRVAGNQCLIGTLRSAKHIKTGNFCGFEHPFAGFNLS